MFLDTHFQMPILAPYAKSLGASPFIIGLIVGIYSFCNIIGNIVSGHIIDNKKSKMPLTAGIITVTLCLFCYAHAYSPFMLLLIRAVHGLAGGLIIPATLVYITGTSVRTVGETSVRTAGDSGLSKNLSKRMSLYGAAIGLSALTGPPLAGILANAYGYGTSYNTMAFLMLLALFPVIFILQEKESVKSSPDKLRYPLKRMHLSIAYRMVFVQMGATGTLASFLPSKAEILGASTALTGGLYAVFAGTAIAVHLAWPVLAKRFLTIYNSLAGVSLLGLALLLIHFASSLPFLFIALFVYGAGFGILFPALLEMVAKNSKPEWKGMATGIFFVFFSLGAALVPPLSGLLLQSGPALSPFLTAFSILFLITLTVVMGNKTTQDRQ